MNNDDIIDYISNNDNNDYDENIINDTIFDKPVIQILYNIRNVDRYYYEYEIVEINGNIINNIIVYKLNNSSLNMLLEGIYCDDLKNIDKVKFSIWNNGVEINLKLNENTIVINGKIKKYYSFEDYPIKLYGNNYVILYIYVKDINDKISIINVKVDNNFYTKLNKTCYEILFDNKYLLLFLEDFVTYRYTNADGSFVDYSSISEKINEEIKRRIKY